MRRGTESADAFDAVAAKLGGSVARGKNSSVVQVDPGKVEEACVAVAAIPGNYHLSTIAATDVGEKIELSYFFWLGKSFAVVRTSVPKTAPRLRSICGSLPAAILYEAEIQDLFGVTFEGNPYTGKKLLLPDNYPEGAPPPFRSEADPQKIREMMGLD